MVVARFDNASSLLEDGRINDGSKRPVTPDPHLDRVVDSFVLKLERTAVIDVRADVFGIGEHLMHRRPCPWALVFPEDASPIECLRNLPFGLSFAYEQFIDLPNNLNLILGPRNQDDSVRLQALPFSTSQKPFGALVPVDQLTPQAIAGRAALSKPHLDEAALAREHLHRELAAVFRSHGALQSLEHRRRHAAVVLELLCAVVNADPSSLENILIVRALIHVLEPTPTAYVIDEEGSEIRPFGFDIRHELVQAVAAGNIKPTTPVIRVLPHYIHIVVGGILSDHIGLILG